MIIEAIDIEVTEKCDVCKRSMGDEYYHARMNCGCWANMCRECFRHFSLGLGSGFGQRYKRNKITGQWQRTER